MSNNVTFSKQVPYKDHAAQRSAALKPAKMATVIEESKRVYRLNIWPYGGQWHQGVQVFSDEDENLDVALNESLSAEEKAELASYVSEPGNYETSLKLAYVEGATVRCSCGAAHQLDGRGDSDCEGCGQPYNTFGQELNRGCYRFTGREGDDDNYNDEGDDDGRDYYDSDDDY